MAQTMEKPQAAARDAVDNVRTATQELHKAISDTLAKRGSATKAQVDAVIKKAKDAAESARSAMNSRQGAAKRQLTEAVAKLEAAQKHAAESLKSSEDAVRKSGPGIGAAVLGTAGLIMALAAARDAAQKISEVVAAQRSEHAAQHQTKKAS